MYFVHDEMDPESESEELPPTDWTIVHNALIQENAQWLHQMNIIDAQNNRVGVVQYTPTQTFQHRYTRTLVARNYPNRRSQSLPAPYKMIWQVQPALPTTRGDQNDRECLRWLRRVKNSGTQKLQRAKDTGVDKLRRVKDATVNKSRWVRDRVGPLVHNIHRRKCRNVFIGMGLGLLVALAYTNGRAAHYKALQVTPASLYIGSFANHPIWLHTDPVQVIGLPAQVDPSFIPSRGTIKKACSRFKSTWHTDKWDTNNFTRQQDDLAVIHRGDEACQLLERYHDNQYCRTTHNRITNFDVATGYKKDPIILPIPEGFPSVPVGAPHFAKDCACTYARYRRKWWYHLLMPVDLQPDAPKTLEETCPCTYEMAMESWRSFSFDAKSPQPPYLSRIKNNLTLPTTDLRVLWWRAKGLVFHNDRDFDSDGESMACAMGTHEGCKNMEGWTSFSDFNEFARKCHRTRALPDPKDEKVEEEVEEEIDESEMSEAYKQALKEEQAAKEAAEIDEYLPEFLRKMEEGEEARSKNSA